VREQFGGSDAAYRRFVAQGIGLPSVRVSQLQAEAKSSPSRKGDADAVGLL